ncbi:MAG: SEC-C metal-binding domain-containing protein, partial [Steroidobacteraceae bacterium]
MSCPCGSSLTLDRCCGAILDGATAPTAEALM